MMAFTTYILYYPGSGCLVSGGSGWRNTWLFARNSSSLIGYYGPISVSFLFI